MRFNGVFLMGFAGVCSPSHFIPSRFCGFVGSFCSVSAFVFLLVSFLSAFPSDLSPVALSWFRKLFHGSCHVFEVVRVVLYRI